MNWSATGDPIGAGGECHLHPAAVTIGINFHWERKEDETSREDCGYSEC